MSPDPAAEGPEAMIGRLLADLPAVRQVWLFGSRARGDAAPRSDVDIAIAAPEATAAGWQDILDRIEEAPTLLRVDVTRLEEASPAFRAEILQTGKLLHERR
jgi:uncharacterized protein